MQRTSLLIALVALVSVGLDTPTRAQMAHRLKGSLTTIAGAPVTNGQVRADNLSGFRGEQFVGQKDHTTTSNQKGEWNITGIESGLWLFTATAPDVVPAAIVIPVKFAQRQQVSAVGNSLQALTVALGRDWEAAGRQIWDARDLVPKDQRRALAAAIDDLRGTARIQ